MMKYFTLLKNFLYLALLLSSPLAFSQNVGVNSSGSAPDASAGLDVSFSNKGLLIPRIALTSTTDVTTITSPATSLLVYNTAIAGTAPNDVTPGYYYFNGSIWLRLSTNVTSSQWTTNGSNVYYTGGNVGIGVSNPTYKLHIDGTSNPLFLGGVENGSTSDSVLTITNGLVKKLPQNGLLATSWGLTGNTGTSSNFIGTTNNDHLRFRTNNTQALVIDSLGSVAIGSSPVFSSTAREKLLVDVGGTQGSPTTSYNGFVVKGYSSTYLQLNVQNKYSGTSASTDIVATANNGNEDNYYIDMGINNTGNTVSNFGGANDAYLYNKGQDLLIGTATSGKSIQFLTGGSDETSNERMRITGTGNVGIGTTNPSSHKLHVVATTNPLYLGGVQGTSTADSILTINNGAVKKTGPTWSLSGNSITSGQKFGSTNNQSLSIITNNSERMNISNTGSIGIGTSPQTSYKLSVSSSSNPLFLSGVQLQATADTVLTINAGVVKKALQTTVVNQSWSLSGNSVSSDKIIGNTTPYALKFFTDNSERMRISDVGFIGIGNNNPQYKLHVSDSADPLFLGGVQNDEFADTVLTISGGIVKQTLKSAINSQPWSVLGNSLAEERTLGTTSNHALPFITNNQERMRIAENGDVVIGTETPENGFLLTVNGALKCYGLDQSSDRRLKKNIKNLNYGLKDVVSLQPVTYNWIDPKQTDKTQIGLIAQDLKPIMPELVNGDEEKGKLSVNYIGLVPVLINAIKEQQSKLDAQQKQIDELKELVQKSLSNK